MIERKNSDLLSRATGRNSCRKTIGLSKLFPDTTLYRRVAERRGILSFSPFKSNVIIGRCSLYGLWGNATLGGKTLQLRALDWDVDGGLQDYPVITIYHPTTSKLGHPFANVAWAGT